LFGEIGLFVPAGVFSLDRTHGHSVRVDLRELRGGQFVNRQKRAAKIALAEQEVFINSFRAADCVGSGSRISARAENDEIFPKADIGP